MIGYLIGCGIVAGGYFYYNKKNNKDSAKVGINNFIFVNNSLYGKKANAFAVRDDLPTLVFNNINPDLNSDYIEMKFDARNNISLSFRSPHNEDHNTDFDFSDFDRDVFAHSKCVYRNFSKVNISQSLFEGYREYYNKFFNQALYALSCFVQENEDLEVFKTILSSYNINQPDEYIKHFESGSKVPYKEEKIESEELIASDELFSSIDFKLVDNVEAQKKFEDIVSLTTDILKHQHLLSIESTTYIKHTMLETLHDALKAYTKINNKQEGSDLLLSILDNIIERLNKINFDKDDFYVEKLKNLSKFSEDKLND